MYASIYATPVYTSKTIFIPKHVYGLFCTIGAAESVCTIGAAE
jgi:hypothetical protein